MLLPISEQQRCLPPLTWSAAVLTHGQQLDDAVHTTQDSMGLHVGASAFELLRLF